MKHTTATGILGLAFTALAISAATAPARADDKVVYINSAGGALDEINRKIYWDPFTKETGIKVIDSAPADPAKMKAMVDSGNVIWDIAEVDGGDFPRLQKAGYLQKLDLSKLPVADLTKEGVNDYGVWINVYSTVMIWDTDKWPLSGKHPMGVKDLWNQKDFPGPRCIGKFALDNLEFALAEAGKDASNMYPIDEKAAYEQLDKLKDDVAVWWTTGAQSIQALVDKECVMGTTYNGRPFQMSKGKGTTIAIGWDGGVMHEAWWAIPKGAKNYDNAMKLLAYMQNPKLQADQANQSGYVGPNTKAADFLSPSAKEFVANTPEHLPHQMTSNAEWWTDNGPAAENRFLSWILK